MTVSGSLPEVGELSSTADPKVRTLLNELKTEVNTQGELQHAVKWYEPKVIATEQTRESVSLGTLSTADEVTGVVVPANGVLRIGYRALWKSSVSAAGRAVITLNGTSLLTIQTGAAAAEATTNGTVFHTLSTASPGSGVVVTGLVGGAEFASLPTSIAYSFLEVDVPAATYAVAVKFSATSGSVTAKERKLSIEVHGT